MTNFPASIDSFNNPTSSTKTNAIGFDHASQHSNANDAIESIETVLGVANSTDVNSIDYKIRRLLSRELTTEAIGVGDGVITSFSLNFTPVGDVFVMVNDTRVVATVSEPTPGSFLVTCSSAPILSAIVSIIAIKETV